MIHNVFEESTLTLHGAIKRGSGARKKAKFTIRDQTGGVEDIETAEIELGAKDSGEDGNKIVSTKVTVPKCKDDEDFYEFSYDVECGDDKFTGPKFRVWLKTATLKCVDAESGDPLEGVPLLFSQSGDKVFVTDKKGECSIPITGTAAVTSTVKSPCEFEEWVQETGRLREAKVTKFEYTAMIADPISEGNTEDNPLKQYVNLKQDSGDAREGSRMKVTLGGNRGEECFSGIPGDKFHVKAEFHKDNSKRNDPAPALYVGGTEFKPNDKGIAEAEVTIPDEGVAEFEVELGKAGGDQVKLMVGITKAAEDATLYVQNWRRLWYQLTLPEGAAEPDLTRMVDALGEVYVEYIKEGATVTIAAGDEAPDGISWFDGAWVKRPGETLLNVGGYNRAYYHSKLVDAKTPWQVHVLCCNTQYDPGEYKATGGLPAKHDTEVAWSDGTKVVGVETYVSKGLMPKALDTGDSAFISGTWRAKGAADNGAIDEADVWIDQHWVTVKLPQDAIDYLDGDDAKEVTVNVTLDVMAGPFLGESSKHKQLIVIDQSSIGVNDTLTHELGHSINQVPTTAGEKAPGLKTEAHARAYTDNKHQGGHCADGMTADNYAGGSGKAGTAYQGNFRGKSECTCVMFGEDNSACTGKFCDLCKPFVKADAIGSLH
jgi:hypothetical protein